MVPFYTKFLLTVNARKYANNSARFDLIVRLDEINFFHINSRKNLGRNIRSNYTKDLSICV
ncbi:MAG: hypothetical protein CVU39_16435 [Chloroflexi bacterium HGW-Chloroflexi-10]|nr:MAG: hypothetical protein CVU39_16435 [Chloroflexi bacterium HGW-Chloroflexi-10]